MNIEQIKELISVVEKSAITSFEMEESGYRIRIGKEDSGHSGKMRTSQEFTKTGCFNPPFSAESSDFSNPYDSVAIVEAEGENQNGISSVRIGSDPGGIEVKSPMLGVFYASASPEEAPFVKIGDRIKKGDVLCIIEAMKLMNEILAEKDGEITGICVENGQIAEFAQTLFTLKP